MKRLGRALLWACVALVCLARGARAESRRESFIGKEFNIDLVNGPIVGTSRVISLGGAYTALGTGIDNAVITPAAYAARTLWGTRWFELDVTVDYSPNLLRMVNFIDNGKRDAQKNSDLLFLGLGLGLVFGEVGIGGIVRSQDYRIGDNVNLTLILANYGACYAFLQGQLLVGVAARTAALTLSNTEQHTTLGSFTHSGPEVGAIVAPADVPYRVGVAVRSALEAESEQHIPSELPFMPPKAVVLPAELQIGVAYQLGNRPLNRRWVNPNDRERALRNEMLVRRLQRQREQARSEHARGAVMQPSAAGSLPLWLQEPRDPAFWRAEGERMANEERELRAEIERREQRYDASIRALSRKYLLLAADLLVVGATDRGIGLESFLSQGKRGGEQRPQTAGEHPSFAFRVGLEGEPIPNQLRVRVGSYLEAARFEGVAPRLHATMGGDMKLFAFDLFGLVRPFELRLTAGLDIATSYRNLGLSVGVWH